MNLPKFLNKVDKMTGKLSKKELESFIHESARILPEMKREDFLRRLRGGQSEELCGYRECDLEKACEDIKKGLIEIEEGNLCLEATLNEEYDDWYHDDENEFLYSDPNGVMDLLEQAVELVHYCLDHEEYRKAYELAESLIGIEISAENEYWDDQTLSLDELGAYGLDNLDYSKFVRDAVYAAYRAHPLKGRADAVYQMIEHSGRHDITLEMIMQQQEELPEIQEFLGLWIAFLGDNASANAQRLLHEALEMTNNPKQMLQAARRYSSSHPDLYERYLRNCVENNSDLFQIGEEALAEIETRYLVRGRIARLLGQAACREQSIDKAEHYWLEAFRSETCVTNFLRLDLESKDSEQYADDIKRICHSACSGAKEAGAGRCMAEELRENRPSFDEAYMLMFLCGEFQTVKESAMNRKTALGWSSTFMKCGLAAFLLLLMDSEELQMGGIAMCGKIVSAVHFSMELYHSALAVDMEGNDRDEFWSCFCRWKGRHVLSDEEQSRWMQWVKKLIDLRVQGIMDNNRRNYYGECAAYIAAYGEALESQGVRDGKQKIMLEYKQAYSRRSAFCGELRAYGMRDTKTKKRET